VQKNVDDDRIEMLERMIREASDTVMESERKYEEVQLFSSRLYIVTEWYMVRSLFRFLVDCYHLSVCCVMLLLLKAFGLESSFSVCTHIFRIFILSQFLKVVLHCISAGIRQDDV